ncbi:phage head closure protein [Youngiibacter multivorans]|uniref:SPP1 family predicted phage head-tail adaptor n=1 Tax=Youngiibacter multivorans TaxID=937251 RepID=A0ABS4G6X3_9CLOT|nr:phage head closure protein [Youngiibacter multivorans]MBP1920320.1 SPP1 family predicted phage head-tail adaptor [Youngiibacter multivorans]
MTIGEMRHRITIQRVTISTNENGYEVETPEVIKEVWAKVANLHGKEYFAAKAVQADNTVKFTIRYMSGLDQSMQIHFQGKVYNITAIDNIKCRNEYIEIQAKEVDSNG